MKRTLSMTEAQRQLKALPDEFAAAPDSGAVVITKRGKPVMVVVPWTLYESISETLEIVTDDELMAALHRSERETSEGKAIPWEQAKRDLAL